MLSELHLKSLNILKRNPTMSQILNKIHDVDPNDSDAVKDVVTVFFQQLPKYTETEPLRWLRVMEDVINRFPKYCLSHRNTIETILCKYLDSMSYHNVIIAAKCAHSLQQIRPSQQKTATPKTCWREQMNTLCQSIHSLLSAIFPNAVDIYNHSNSKPTIKVDNATPLSAALHQIASVPKHQAVNKQAVMCTRLRNVFVFLQAMIVDVYPAPKPIRLQTILDVIVRSISITSSAKVSHQELSDVIMVKTQALRSLDALVACLGSNLIPYGPLVFRIISQTLKWTSQNSSDESRIIRIASYNSLTRWLKALHSHRADNSGRGLEDELTTHILDDVTPPKHVVQLNINAQPTKHLSKKAKRKLANTMLKDSSISSHMPGEKNKIKESEEVNDEVAIAALECAETFLVVCGIFLKATTHKRFHERLVRECYTIQSYSTPRVLNLLRVLDACRKSAPNNVPPPTQYCLQLFSTLVNSDSSEISSFCSQALLDIRLHLHCSPPSLNFALEVQPNQKSIEEKKNKISERNRAALKALLGADKIPSLSNGEVITINDEPANKKPRLETDQISVSSDSEGSIEISDDENTTEEAQVDVEKHVETQENKNFIDTRNIAEEHTQCFDETDSINENNTAKIEGIDSKDKDIIVDEQDIYEARTQLPIPSNDALDDEGTQSSIEVVYDYPNARKEEVKLLEGLDGDNLPSTNETDDIQITCGQDVKYSQDGDVIGKAIQDSQNVNDIPKINNIDKEPTLIVENGYAEKEVDRTARVTSSTEGVEDMLADFVDEVIEEAKIN